MALLHFRLPPFLRVCAPFALLHKRYCHIWTLSVCGPGAPPAWALITAAAGKGRKWIINLNVNVRTGSGHGAATLFLKQKQRMNVLGCLWNESSLQNIFFVLSQGSCHVDFWKHQCSYHLENHKIKNSPLKNK